MRSPFFVGVWEEIVDAIQLVPQEQVFEECVQNRASDHGGVLAFCTTGTRAESYAGADSGFPCASDHGGRLAGRTTRALAKSYAGADCGFPCAPVHGGSRGESRRGADCGSLCPSVHGADVEIMRATPQESVQNRTHEQIVDSVPRVTKAVVEVVPPTLQERVQNRPRKFFVDLPVPLITDIMADVFGLPQERVQNRATYTEKVFTVRHHRDDRVCTVDNVEFIKGLDKFNLPRVGDVMVPALQITKGIAGHVEQVVSWFDRKSQVAADVPVYRFQPQRPGRSSRCNAVAVLRQGTLRSCCSMDFCIIS